MIVLPVLLDVTWIARSQKDLF